MVVALLCCAENAASKRLRSSFGQIITGLVAECASIDVRGKPLTDAIKSAELQLLICAHMRTREVIKSLTFASANGPRALELSASYNVGKLV